MDYINFVVMHFGLNGDPATFQRMMDGLLHGLEYIIILSEDMQRSYQPHAKSFIMSEGEQLEGKIEIGMAECKYLGYIVRD